MRNRSLAAGVKVLLSALLLSVSLAGCADKGSAAKESEADVRPEVGESAERKEAQDPEGLENDELRGEADASGKDGKAGLSEDAAYLFDVIRGWTFCFESGAGGWDTTLTVDAEGNFNGLFHDSDMGDTGEGYDYGTLYQCTFHGRFTDVTKKSQYVYEAKVEGLAYDRNEGETEIIDQVRHVYSNAYGISGAETVEIYLPGAKVADLPEGYMSWIQPLHFGVYALDHFYWDIPEELPFCGIYNPAEQDGFFSDNVEGKNSVYLVNKASFPGLRSVRRDLNADGTYFYEDVAEDGTYAVRSLCYRDEQDFSFYDGREEQFVKDCISHLLEGAEARDVYYLDSSFRDSTPDMTCINGHTSYMAGWTVGSNEDTRYYVARMTKLGSYIYVYGYSGSEYDEYLHGEAGAFLLSSLTFSGNQDRISSASTENVVRKVHAVVINRGTDPMSIYADEVIWVGSGDEALIEKYHLTEEDLTNDYAIVGIDGNYKEYQLSDRCPIYIQYPEEGPFWELQGKGAFHKKLAGGTYDYLMELYLDENDNVTFLYEPYRP